MAPDSPLVTVDRRDGFAIVALNRPVRRNALTPQLLVEFQHVMQELDEDPEIAVLILTGAGDHFCVGLDVAVLQEQGADAFDPCDLAGPISDWSGPVIAAINGLAVTGGFEIALACDVILAADDAVFIDTHSRVGLLPGSGLAVRLQRAIGIYRAKEIQITGRRLPAAEAAEWGMVNRVVPSAQLLDAASEMARTMIAGAPGMPQAIKSIIDRCSHVAVGEAIKLERSVSLDHANSGEQALQFNHVGGSRSKSD